MAHTITTEDERGALSPIRVGLVGYGMVSQVFHAPLVSQSKRFILSHVLERSTDKARQSLPVERVTTLDELLVSDVELVVVATPTASHFETAKAVLSAKKHCVCEKPFTVSAAEATELHEMACAQGVMLTVFHNRRWDGDFLTLRRVLASGELGEVVEYSAAYDRFRPSPKGGWRERDEPGSGVLYDLGSHLIDQAVQIFGRPSAVMADVRKQRDPDAADDFFELTLRYSEQPALRVSLRASCINAANASLPRYAIHGRGGSFVKRGLDVQEDQLKAGGHPGTEDWGVEPAANHGILSLAGAAERIVPSERGCYETFYDQVADAIRLGKPAPVDASDAALVVRIIECARESAENGVTVAV